MRRGFASRPLHRVRRHLRLMLVFVAGMAGALAAIAVAAGAVVGFGLYDVSAATPHFWLVTWATHTTFVNSVTRQAAEIPQAPPVTLERLRAGLLQYQQDCVACHGGPGIARASWVSGMNPTPPYLTGMGARWTSAQLYWIIANGSKMTGMPAWSVSRSDRQIQDLVAFVQALPRIRPDVYARVVAANPRPAPADSPNPD
jgi:mono/diheme cytochrome c family protein